MPSMIENVFIFGVILPAIVTVVVFAVFLVCWFKCNIREKLQNRFPFCKKKTKTTQNDRNNGTSGDTNNTSPKGVHYIQENLDYSSSTGRGSRHSLGDTAPHIQAIPMHDTGHLANMGFEIGEDYVHSSYSSGSARALVGQTCAGPSSSHHSPTSYIFGQNQPISSSSPVEKKRMVNSGASSGDEVTVHMENETTFTTCGEASDNRRNTQTNVSQHSHNHASSATSVYTSPTHSTSYASEQNSHTTTPNMSKTRDSQRRSKWDNSPHLSDIRVSSDLTPGVHKPVSNKSSSSNQLSSPQHGLQGVQVKRVEYIQQVFQFPHSSRHHKALTKSSRNTKPSSLDNSSSSYSSSSNDGDYFDREGDYGQFYPVSHFTTTESQLPQQNSNEVMYTRNTSGRGSGTGKGHGHIDTSRVSYQQGHAMRAPYQHSSELTNSSKQDNVKYGQSSSSSSSSQHRHRPDTRTDLTNMHFISQDI